MQATDPSHPSSGESLSSMPWTVKETWLGLFLMALVIGAMAVIPFFLPARNSMRSLALLLIEPLLLLPVAAIFACKRIGWRHLGFRRFPVEMAALSVGLLLLIYPLIVLHNFVLVWLGVPTQGEGITELYQALDTPFLFFLAGVILAPFSEEVFFRGFLFQGLRQKYGWVNAILISSAIFAFFHLQPAAFIPTFILGGVLGYAFERSNSLWPAILLHVLVNGAAFCLTVAALQMGWF